MALNAVSRALVLLGPLCCALAARRPQHGWDRRHSKVLRADHSRLQAHGENETSGVELLTARKPPRIFRTGQAGKKDYEGGKIHLGKAKCGETLWVTSQSDKYARCPSDCPYYVSDRTDDQHCTFVCVPADQCSRYNPNAPVPDDDKGACRSPMVNHCKEYELSGLDRCKVCKSAYELHPDDGQCYYKYMWAIYLLAAVLGAVALLLGTWVVNLACRPVLNRPGLDDGLSARTACKLRQPMQDGSRPAWPLTTNLMTQDVAGPGMMLHFNFQANLIIWAFGVAIAWVIISYIEDPVFDRLPDLMRIGTRKMGMPRENCILVAWGYEAQQRLMPFKIAFLAVLYVVTFGLCIFHSIRQLRIFEAIDAEESTMTDFAALLHGLPVMQGSQKAEELIKAAVEEQTGQKVVGVSIAWDFKDQEEEVFKAAKEVVYDYDAKDKEACGEGAASSGDAVGTPAEVPHTGLQRKLFDAETSIFGPEDEERNDPEALEKILDELSSTEYAFVVFDTEGARNSAVEELEAKGGLSLMGQMAKIDHVRAEPDTVQWENFGHATVPQIVKRLAVGFGLIFLALVLWTVLFYGPYAWSVFQFNYDNGQQPGFVYGFAFSMVVVIGNAIMYETCARVSDYVGFHFRDSRESCYMILYTIATTFNVLLDFATTYWIVWEVSKGLGFRTYHGVKVKEISSFTQAFETYAMQRQLGENTYTYAFPSTFLIPFLIEPIVTILVPLKLGMMIVRTHPEIVGRFAEEWLASAPMDMGRYADCLLNVVLAVLVLYFPGGWTWQLYFAMAFSHMFIYAFDHWKVLQNIPKCTYASMDVDWWSQALLAPCTGVILSCLIFKANCQDYGFCIDGVPLLVACTAGFFAHCAVHILLLVYAVPMFAHQVVGVGSETTSFKEVASVTACTWFTSNPVHCLRSKYKHKHYPECVYYVVGKEHCLQVNEEANVYYHGGHVDKEDFEESLSQITKLSADVKGELVGLLRQVRTHDDPPQEGDVAGITPAAKSRLHNLAAAAKQRRASEEESNPPP